MNTTRKDHGASSPLYLANVLYSSILLMSSWLQLRTRLIYDPQFALILRPGRHAEKLHPQGLHPRD